MSLKAQLTVRLPPRPANPNHHLRVGDQFHPKGERARRYTVEAIYSLEDLAECRRGQTLYEFRRSLLEAGLVAGRVILTGDGPERDPRHDRS